MSVGCSYGGKKFCRHEFNTIFFGRRDSNRYKQTDTRGIGTANYDPYKSQQQESEEKINKQLRFQLILGGLILLLFIVTLTVVITMMFSKEEAREFLRLEPRNSQGGGVVWVDRRNDDDLAALLARINGELDEYEIKRWYPRLSKAGRKPKNCEAEGSYPIPGREVCVPKLDIFGSCNTYGAFGYIIGDPCILIKAGAALSVNYTENLLISCRAAIDADGTKLGLRYYPRVTYLGQVYAYFPRYFFPYVSDGSLYLPPLAMVQVLDPPKSRSFHVNCTLANPTFFANASTKASLQMLFL